MTSKNVTINPASTYRHPSAAAARLPSQQCLEEKVLTASSRPDMLSKWLFEKISRTTAA